MNRDEAEALAVKRNAHKSKALVHKTWKAIEENGQWGVKLLDDNAHKIQQAEKEMKKAREDARMALAFGNLDGFLDAARRNLMAQCQKTVSEYQEMNENPPSAD